MPAHHFPWEQQSRIGLFCDPFLADVNTESAYPESTLQEVAGWLQEFADSELIESASASVAVKEAARLFVEAAEYATQARASFQYAGKIAEWCTRVQDKLNNLGRDEMFVLLGGWWFNEKKNGNQPVFYIFHNTGADGFAISICNAGAGVNDYHETNAGPDPFPKEKYVTSWRLLGIPKERVVDIFWLNALFSAYFTKRQFHEPGLIYETLLPYVLPSGDIRAATDRESLMFSTMQRSAASTYKCIPAALRLILQARGVGQAERKRLMCGLRLQELRKMWTALTPNGLTSLAPSDRMVIECACRQVALKVLREERAGMAPDKIAWAQSLIKDVQERVRKSQGIEQRFLSGEAKGLCAGGPPDNVGYAGFPGWELISIPWFTRENRRALRHLMGDGSSQKLPSLIDIARLEALQDPVELITETRAACDALAAESQELLSKMRIGALIEAVFTRQIPPGHPRWKNLFFTKDQQKKVLEHTWCIFQHYMTVVAMSFTPRRQFSAQILTARCLHLAFEILLRCQALDGLLPVTAAIRSPEGGDLLPMWTFMGEADLFGRSAGVAMEGLPFPSPELARVWDALQRHDDSIRASAWDSSIRQMKVVEDSMRPTQELTNLLTKKVLGIDSSVRPETCHEDWPKWTWVFAWAFDNSGEVATKAPEWCWWRDICMWCKYLCLNTESRRFNRKRSYQARDAKITWAYGFCDCNKALTLRPSSLCGEVQLKNMCPCAGARPVLTGTSLEAVGMKEGSKTEDDVVHAPRLPNFKGAFAQEEAEILLSLLTTPYLRIPLLLHFLAADRLHALKEASFQELVWSVMSEPSTWANEDDPPGVTTAPAEEASMLGTSFGILFNEVRRSLHSIFSPLRSLCQQADELASVAPPNDFDGGAADILLFIVRIVVRFQMELNLYCREGRAEDAAAEADMRVEVQEELRIFIESTARKHIVRWLAAATQDVAARVKLHAHLVVSCSVSDLSVQQNLTMYLGSSSYVNAWYASGMEEQLGAELQFVFDILQRRRVEVVDLLERASGADRQSVLDNLARVASNFSTGGVAWEGGPKLKKETGETPAEKLEDEEVIEFTSPLPDNWPSHGNTIYKNMQMRFPDAGEEVIIQAMKIANYHGANTVRKLKDYGYSEIAVQKADLARSVSPTGEMAGSRFGDPGLWRCPRPDGAAVYNAQTATLWLESGLLQPIPAGIKRLPDFDQCFQQRPTALAPTSRPLLLARQCQVFAVQDAEEATLELQWWYSCYDILRVEAEDGLGQVYNEARWSTHGTMALGYPWRPCDDYERPNYKKLNGVARADFEAGDVAKWLSVEVGNKGLLEVWEELLRRAKEPANQAEQDALQMLDGEWMVQKGRFNDQVLEVSALRRVVVRSKECWLELRFACQGRPVVRGFTLGEFGRHVYREQIFSSDAHFSYAEFEPNSEPRREPMKGFQCLGKLSAQPCGESLVVTDDGLRVWVPSRALCGLLPDVLLESYNFWMYAAAGGSVLFTGEPMSPLVYSTLSYQLQVCVDAKGVACVTRKNPNTKESWLLASPLHAPAETQLALFMAMLAPLEAASHVLFWVKFNPETLSRLPDGDAPACPPLAREVSGTMRSSFDPDAPDAPVGKRAIDGDRSAPCPTGGKEVALVELPRLQMKFEPGADPMGHGVRLFSKEFRSFYVIDRRSCHNATEWLQLLADPRAAEIVELLACMPHAIVLRSASGALRILAANVIAYRPYIESKPFSTELVVDRRYLRMLGQRHFVWEVHDSALLLLSSSLSGTLCLCFLLLLQRQYERCVRYLQSICFDEEISKDEKLLIKLIFVLTKGDAHPDAHALRLKLLIAMAQHNPKHPWLKQLIPKEYVGYLSKLTHVSRACRLLFREEAVLIEALPPCQTPPRVARRSVFVDAVLGGAPNVQLAWQNKHPAEFHNGCFGKERWSAAPFERIINHAWRENIKVKESELGSTISDLTALISLSRTCDDADWSGAHCTLFTYVYSILSGESKLLLNGRDVAGDFVRLALQKYWLRTMRISRGGNDTQTVLGTLWGTLALRELRRTEELPRCQELLDIQTECGWGFVRMFDNKYGQPWMTRLCIVIRQYMRNITDDSGLFVAARMAVNTVDSKAVLTIPSDKVEADLLQVIPRPPAKLDDFSRSTAALKSAKAEIVNMLGMPLESIAAASVTHFSAASHVPPNALTRETLKKMPAGMTRVATDIITRLESGHAVFMEKSAERKACSLSCFMDFSDLNKAMQDLVTLESQVRDVWSADLRAMQSAQRQVLAQANDVPDSASGFSKFWMRRCGGLETHVWIEWCIGAELDNARGFSGVLQDVNSHVRDPDGIQLAVLELMLQTTRVAQSQLVLVAVQDLLAAAAKVRAAGPSALDKGGGEELQALAERAAQLLAAVRSYTNAEEEQIEPAFLFFEYVTGFLIRRAQVNLIRRFAATAAAGDSLVAQMIMGAGKTTCIAPMLTLLLGNEGRLVLNVVPKNLLAQTRGVMRKIFGQILAKRVVTLDFSRMMGQEDPFEVTLVRSHLFDAQRDAAVVCTTPAAIKSLFLRFLELIEINHLNVTQEAKDSKAYGRADHVSRERLKRRIANLNKQIEENRAMANCLGNVLTMLRRNSCALIDEVDLVLHPLKSELNFPIGDMEMYDLGNDRWHLVVHLLDALFLINEGHAASGSFYPDIREGHLDSDAEEAEAKAEIEAVAKAKDEERKAKAEEEKRAREAREARAKPRRSVVLARGKAVHAAPHKPKMHPARKAKVGGKGKKKKDPPPEEAAEPVTPKADAAPEESAKEASDEPPEGAGKGMEIKKRGAEIIVEVASRISALEVEIPQLVEQGYDSLALQRQPHLVILSTAFYHNRLRRPLAEWLACWILSHDDAVGLWVVGIGVDEVSTFLSEDLHKLLASPLKLRVEQAATKHLCKLLSLGREWLFNLLPHVLSKIDRVHYGLLTEAELASEESQKAAPSRRLLAVPFVGKDKPSPAAEFAQPDVLIGFSILAYRYEGLRISDITSMFHHLQQKAGRESGPWSARPTCALFEWWKDLGRKRLIGKGLKASESDTTLSWEVDHDGLWKPLRSAINERLREAAATKQTVVRFKAEGGNDYEIDLEWMVQRSVASGKVRKIRQIMSAPAIDHLRLPELQALAVSGGDDEAKKKDMAKKKAEEEAEKKKKEDSLDDDEKKAVGGVEEKGKRREADEEQVSHIAVAVELLGSVPEIVLWYLLQMVFDTVLRQQPFKLSATGQELGSSMLFTSRIGFSGTPSSLLPEELGACLFEAENEGEILSVLSDEKHVVPPLMEMPTDWTPASILDRVACCESPRFHALIDTGALVMGMTNEEVAQALLRKLPPELFDGVVYFDDRDAPMVRVRSARQPLLLAEAGVHMDRRFTFFDQVHTTGTDTKQPLQSFAALTVSASMTFRDYAQGAWRMRGLGKGQKLQMLLTPELVKRVQNTIQSALGSEDDPAPRLGLNEIVSFLLSNGFESEGRQAAALEMQNLATIWRRVALNKVMKYSTMVEREKNIRVVGAFKESLRFPVDGSVQEPPGLCEKMQQAMSENMDLMDKPEIQKCKALIEAAAGGSDGGGGDLGVEITRQQEKEQEKQQEKEKEVETQVGRERDGEVPWPLMCLNEASLPGGVFYTLSQFRMKGLPSGKELKCSPGSLISSNHTVNDLLGMGARRLKSVILLFVFSHASGKRTIAVSLAEGAAIRRAGHLNVSALPADCMLWLRADCQKVSESSHLLMGSGKRIDVAAGLMQARRLDAARQMLRFFNCDLDFKPEEVTVSVGALEAGDVNPPDRQLFIDAVLRARRREACAWRDTPLGEIVRGDGEELEWAQALVVRLHGCMTRVLGLTSAVDMFKMLDVSGHGTILFDTFQKSLSSKLPGEFSAVEIRELFQQADRSDNGHLTYVDVEELFRYGAVAGGGPEPAKLGFVPSPRADFKEEEACAVVVEEGDSRKAEGSPPRGGDTAVAAPDAVEEKVEPRAVGTGKSAKDMLSISREAGEALISELKAKVDDLFKQHESLVGNLCAARERKNHQLFLHIMKSLAELGSSEVPEASEAVANLAQAGAKRVTRSDRTAYQLAVLTYLDVDDDPSYKEDLEKMYSAVGTKSSLRTGAANIEKEALLVRDTWNSFRQMWSDIVVLPAAATSVPDLTQFARSREKSLVAQAFVLERLYRIDDPAVCEDGFRTVTSALLLAISRFSEEEFESKRGFADKVIQWGLVLLVKLVKSAPEDAKKELSKHEFVEVGNQLWAKFQHRLEVISPLSFVLAHVPVQITRWQVLISEEESAEEEWQNYKAEQALSIRHAKSSGKPSVYFSIDSVPYIIVFYVSTEQNLDTKCNRRVRELSLEISEPAG